MNSITKMKILSTKKKQLTNDAIVLAKSEVRSCSAGEVLEINQSVKCILSTPINTSGHNYAHRNFGIRTFKLDIDSKNQTQYSLGYDPYSIQR